MRLIPIVLVCIAGCAHSPSQIASYSVEVHRADREICSFRAMGAYEISGGVSAVFWFSRSDTPVLSSGLVVAGLEFTASSNRDGAFVVPFALIGTREERKQGMALNRSKEPGFQLVPGDPVVVSHLKDGTELPFPLEFSAHPSEHKPEEIQ